MKRKEIREGLCPRQPAGSVAAGLQDLADPVYQAFFARLVPKGEVLGVKMPALRTWVKGLSEEERQSFMTHLPHRYVEENQAHVLMINEMREFGAAADALRRFAPFADNWAVTDALNPRAFRCDPDTESLACELLRDDNPYAVRMGMLILMRRFLKTDPHLPQILAVRRSHNTLAMMTAWFLAELAVHDPEAVLDVIDTLDWATAKRLGQKVRDSRRIGQNVKDRISEACRSRRPMPVR